ncbi:MAG: hypothetical protein B9S32_01445 [Verrucomicrobia bacterium Tous-C9LFEB]|nr:MAG: hypothetical protein B9S32_01445 [Verrucomicrobia bacterium Tous-C9LFEB]
MKKLLRRLHLYLGVFFAPLLLLFVITGWWQTVTINRNKGLGFGQTVIEKLSTVHIDQYYPVTGTKKYRTDAFKILTIALCIGLILAIVLGIWMGFQTPGHRLGSLIALLLGIAVPVVILALAPHRGPPSPAPAAVSASP